jgi:hypothetical protein
MGLRRFGVRGGVERKEKGFEEAFATYKTAFENMIIQDRTIS